MPVSGRCRLSRISVDRVLRGRYRASGCAWAGLGKTFAQEIVDDGEEGRQSLAGACGCRQQCMVAAGDGRPSRGLDRARCLEVDPKPSLDGGVKQGIGHGDSVWVESSVLSLLLPNKGDPERWSYWDFPRCSLHRHTTELEHHKVFQGPSRFPEGHRSSSTVDSSSCRGRTRTRPSSCGAPAVSNHSRPWANQHTVRG